MTINDAKTSAEDSNAAFDAFVRGSFPMHSVGSDRVNRLVDRCCARLDLRPYPVLAMPPIFPPQMRIAIPLAALMIGIMIGMQLPSASASDDTDYSVQFLSGTILQGDSR